MIRPGFIFKIIFALAVAFLCVVGPMDYADALNLEAEEKVARVHRVLLATSMTRESWILTHPLSCDGTKVKSCADFNPCTETCLKTEEQ